MTARQNVSARHGTIAVYDAAGQFALHWFALCHLNVCRCAHYWKDGHKQCMDRQQSSSGVTNVVRRAIACKGVCELLCIHSMLNSILYTIILYTIVVYYNTQYTI